MTIKTFKDGNRFVIVFEGLQNEPSTEDMIKSIISSVVTSASVDTLPDATAIPIEVPEEKIPEIPFEDGYFEGKTRSEALKYLRDRFKDTNASEYAQKLNNKQKANFLNMFRDVIPEGIDDVKSIIEGWKKP